MILYLSAWFVEVRCESVDDNHFLMVARTLAKGADLCLHVGLTPFNFNEISSLLPENVVTHNLLGLDSPLWETREKALITQIQPDWVIHFKPETLDLSCEVTRSRVALFVTEMDHLTDPYLFNPKERARRDAAWSNALPLANLIVTPTREVRDNILRSYGGSQTRFKVVMLNEQPDLQPAKADNGEPSPAGKTDAATEFLALLREPSAVSTQSTQPAIAISEPILVSIVTPSYQQAQFLRQCIDSVLAQDYPHIEYLVLDGGSDDGSRKILESYGSSFFWKSERDGGQTNAINAGFRRAKGNLLGYLNSDDMLLPGAISSVVEEFEKRPALDVLYGRAHFIDETGQIIGDYDTLEFDPESFRARCYICQPAAYWRRRIMDRAGLFDERFQIAMDYEYWQRIVARGGLIAMLDKFLACSRDYPATKTRSQRGKACADAFRSQWLHWGNIHSDWWMALFDYLKNERRGIWRALGAIPAAKRRSLSTVLSKIVHKKPHSIRFEDRLEESGMASFLLKAGCDSEGWVRDKLSISLSVNRKNCFYMEGAGLPRTELQIEVGSRHNETIKIGEDGKFRFEVDLNPGTYLLNIRPKSANGDLDQKTPFFMIRATNIQSFCQAGYAHSPGRAVRSAERVGLRSTS